MVEEARFDVELDEVECRVRLMECAAELLAQTLFGLRTSIDRSQQMVSDQATAELGLRIERLAESVSLIQRRVARIAPKLAARSKSFADAERP